MAKLPDRVPATPGHGFLRVSHAHREQVIDILKAAFVRGMLTKDEFDLRVSRAFASRTGGELAAFVADLPAGLAAAQPPGPARAQGQARVLRFGARPRRRPRSASQAGVSARRRPPRTWSR